MRTLITRTCVVLAAAAALTLAVQTVQAGPPLICHEFTEQPIDLVPSTSKSKQSGDRVVKVVLEHLDEKQPVLARMEIMRRAAITLQHDGPAADRLLGRLMQRALDAEAAGTPDAFAWFDAGFQLAAFQQISNDSELAAVHKGKRGPIAGYTWVARALELRRERDDAMELAAALMTLWPRVPQYEQHLRAVLDSKSSTTPGFQKILAWLADHDGTTVEALRAKYGLADARHGG